MRYTLSVPGVVKIPDANRCFYIECASIYGIFCCYTVYVNVCMCVFVCDKVRNGTDCCFFEKQFYSTLQMFFQYDFFGTMVDNCTTI